MIVQPDGALYTETDRLVPSDLARPPGSKCEGRWPVTANDELRAENAKVDGL